MCELNQGNATVDCCNPGMCDVWRWARRREKVPELLVLRFRISQRQILQVPSRLHGPRPRHEGSLSVPSHQGPRRIEAQQHLRIGRRWTRRSTTFISRLFGSRWRDPCPASFIGRDRWPWTACFAERKEERKGPRTPKRVAQVPQPQRGLLPGQPGILPERSSQALSGATGMTRESQRWYLSALTTPALTATG
eukprot:scaffold1954_cov268-Pinguiococcus_pyrenoidosus.AAC.123